MGPLLALLLGLAILFVLLFLGTALLRAAVSLANRVIGPVRTERFIGWDWDDDSDDTDADAEEPDDRPDQTPAIPEPRTGQGMITVLMLLFLHIAQTLAMAVLVETAPTLRRQDELTVLVLYIVLGSVLGTLVLSGLLTARLGTKWRWAALAAFFFYLILVSLLAGLIGLMTVVFG